MKEIEKVRSYIEILREHMGLDILIYDECGLLRNTALAGIAEIGKWHTNPYCLRIKENATLRARCVALKPLFVRKVLDGEGVAKSTCYCGVTEYVAPIRVQGCLVCMVAAVGFRGALPENVEEILCRRIGMDGTAFKTLRERVLSVPPSEERVMAAVGILQELFFRLIEEETDIRERISAPESNGHVLKAVEFISRSYARPLTATEVAAHCHLNLSYLQHLFSGVLGHGIAEEIRLRRLACAEELLCTTDHSVRYIAFLSGFPSPDYFSTAFKKHFGTSPLRYRKRNRKS